MYTCMKLYHRFDVSSILTREGWGYVWSGARATHGYTAGKVWYEVKLVENLDTKVDESEKRIHELRVGWSTNDTSLQLGEADNSFAYAGNGMAATGNSFDEYAETFAKGKLFYHQFYCRN